MALPSFFKRSLPKAPASKAPKAAKSSPTAPPADPVEVQQARTRARRRLMGAAVLLAAGIVTFPLLFETKPRPMPVDLPIEVAPRDGAPALKPVRPVTPTSAATVDPNANVAVESPPAASAPAGRAAGTPAAASAPAARAAGAVVEARPAVTAKPAPAPAPAVAAPASVATSRVAEAPKPAASAASAGGSGRFVVQVGAFADGAALREVRAKVEKLGLKTYTQVVETEGGKRTRVRVGPFDTRDEAAKALARLKSANLPGAVLTL